MMKIQNLAVIFIIIILPISMVLNTYIGSQVKTLSFQVTYDNKLNNATADALKAFQLNTINSDTSDLANSKIRDIEASAATFFNSIASNFNMAGYNKDALADYVPALVYTMYDGYYIYSDYINTLDDINKNYKEDEVTKENKEFDPDSQLLGKNDDATYKPGEKVTALKPYVYYSCRYKPNDNNDFVITYSMDNYISVQGIVNGEWTNESGYLLDNITGDNGSGFYYRQVPIKTDEALKEYVYNPENDKIEEYKYVKINGIKYYFDTSKDEWFTVMNGKYYKQDNLDINNAGKTASFFYRDAMEFTSWVHSELDGITGKDAVEIGGIGEIREIDERGEEITDSLKLGNYKIFENDSTTSIEDPNSNFNQQRLAVIRYSIEKNLSIAIANYNDYSEANQTSANFQMPKLEEDDWDKLLNNISIISFLQGLSIGGKVYNGYSIITNNKNQELVNEDSIYIIDGKTHTYHRPNEANLPNSTEYKGVLNIDLEVKTAKNLGDDDKAYMPIQDQLNPYIGSYKSIVTQTGTIPVENYYKYMGDMKTQNPNLASAYFTALGREKQGTYKTNNNPEFLKEDYK